MFDLSDSPQTNIDCYETERKIAQILGFSGNKQGNGNVDERTLKKLEIDTRRVGGMPTPATSHCRSERGINYDSFGIGWKYVNGHLEICRNPLKDATIDKVMIYELPDAANIDMSLIKSWKNEAKFF